MVSRCQIPTLLIWTIKGLLSTEEVGKQFLRNAHQPNKSIRYPWNTRRSHTIRTKMEGAVQIYQQDPLVWKTFKGKTSHLSHWICRWQKGKLPMMTRDSRTTTDTKTSTQIQMSWLHSLIIRSITTTKEQLPNRSSYRARNVRLRHSWMIKGDRRHRLVWEVQEFSIKSTK